MPEMHYVGFDVHKKTIVVGVVNEMGQKCQEEVIGATRDALTYWLEHRAPKRWKGAMEATLFTGWIYDELRARHQEIFVGNPQVLDFIAKTKKKSDRLDAEKLANLLRCNLFPCVHMPNRETRFLRALLRHRNFIVRQLTRFKNSTATHLMANGISYYGRNLHGKNYFEELLKGTEIPEHLLVVVRINRHQIDFLRDVERGLRKRLLRHERLRERVERLMTIPGVGVIVALTWCLEIDDPHRFSCVDKAVSYCGLCAAHKESAEKTRRGPLSKQRNKHLQWVLVEAAKIAVRRNAKLGALYERMRRQKNRNAATIAVARKLVALLLALDKSGERFCQDYQANEKVFVPPDPS